MLTKQEFIDFVEFYGENEDNVKFSMPVDCTDLIYNTEGVNFLNNCVDEFVEDGYLLEDLSYKPLFLESDGTIIFEVNAQAQEFLNDPS